MKAIRTLLILFLLFTGFYFVFGQPPGQPPGPPSQGPGGSRPCPLPPCPPVPLTGIEFLIGAGALFGAKKLRDFKKSK